MRIKAKKLVVNAEYVYNAIFDNIQKTTSTICQPINFSLLFLTTDAPKHTTAAKEKRLPKIFEECSNKRVMVLNIQNDDRYITALVLLQDINASFIKPKEKNSLFKATQITFQNAKSFKKWLLNRKRVYTYKITDNTSKSVKVVIFNMSKLDELSVSEVGAQINNVCSIAKYILLETAEKFEKCFS